MSRLLTSLVQALSDPAQDMSAPMKGPFETLRPEAAQGAEEAEAAAAKTAVALCKRAGLLPAALVCAGFARDLQTALWLSPLRWRARSRV